MRFLLLCLSFCPLVAQAIEPFTIRRIVPDEIDLAEVRLAQPNFLVGTYAPIGPNRAMVWNNGEVSLLPGLGSNDSTADRNRSGVVVGYVSGNDTIYASRWINGQLELLRENNDATDINDRGWIAGMGVRNWLLTEEGYTDIPTLPDLPGFYDIKGLSEDGLVAGDVIQHGGPAGSWAWTPNGGIVRLPFTEVMEVLDDGTVLGLRYGLWRNGEFLGRPLQISRGTNERGDIVGFDGNGGRALYADGQIHYFSDLILPEVLAELTIYVAYDVNDARQILIEANYRGEGGYWLLEPVPEPSAFLAIALGTLAVVCRRRQGR